MMLKDCENCQHIFDVAECSSGEFVFVDVYTGETHIRRQGDSCPLCGTYFQEQQSCKIS